LDEKLSDQLNLHDYFALIWTFNRFFLYFKSFKWSAAWIYDVDHVKLCDQFFKVLYRMSGYIGYWLVAFKKTMLGKFYCKKYFENEFWKTVHPCNFLTTFRHFFVIWHSFMYWKDGNSNLNHAKNIIAKHLQYLRRGSFLDRKLTYQLKLPDYSALIWALNRFFIF
jgi:hypothetical protein